VPDFTLSIAGHPLTLKTDYQATVDGTNGDTLLHPVIAHFLNTTLICNGGVVKAFHRPGREIVLDVATDHARLEDLLRLAAKADQPLMTGAVRLTTKFDLPPGDGEIVDRLRLDGKFGIGAAQFANAEVRQKLEGLSRRGQGKPEGEDAGSEVSELKGSFLLRDGQITFRDLTFGVTGATVELAGTYGLRDEKLDFHGTLRLQAKLSQLTTGFDVGAVIVVEEVVLAHGAHVGAQLFTHLAVKLLQSDPFPLGGSLDDLRVDGMLIPIVRDVELDWRARPVPVEHVVDAALHIDDQRNLDHHEFNSLQRLSSMYRFMWKMACCVSLGVSREW
jgi:hypothetical protein